MPTFVFGLAGTRREEKNGKEGKSWKNKGAVLSLSFASPSFSRPPCLSFSRPPLFLDGARSRSPPLMGMRRTRLSLLLCLIQLLGLVRHVHALATCAQYVDEFESFSGDVVSDPGAPAGQARAFIDAPFVGAALTPPGAPGTGVPAIVITGLQLCDGTTDAFLFRAASCVGVSCGAAAAALVEVDVLIREKLRKADVTVEAVSFRDPNNVTAASDIILTDTGKVVNTGDREQGLFRYILQPDDGVGNITSPSRGGTMFLIKIAAVAGKGTGDSPYTLSIRIADASVKCGAGGSRLSTGAKSVAVPAASDEFLDSEGLGVCGYSEYNFPPSWVPDNSTDVMLYSLEKYPDYLVGEVDLGATKGAACCDLGSAVGKSGGGNFKLVLNSTNGLDGVAWKARTAAVSAPIGRLGMSFAAIRCPRSELTPGELIYPSAIAWNDTVSFSPVPLCAVSRNFKIDMSGFLNATAAGEGLWVTVARSRNELLNSPTLEAWFPGLVGYSAAPQEQNTVFITRAQIAAGLASTTDLLVIARRGLLPGHNGNGDAGFPIPEASAITVSFWAAPAPGNCSPGVVSVNVGGAIEVTVCRGQDVHIVVRPDDTTPSGGSVIYDTFLNARISSSPGTPQTFAPAEGSLFVRVDDLVAFGFPGIGWYRFYNTGMLRLPNTLVRPFEDLGPKSDVTFMLRNFHGIPFKAVLNTTTAQCVLNADGYNNFDLLFKSNPDQMPLLPYQPNGTKISANICFKQYDYFRIDPGDADLLEVVVNFQSVDSIAVLKYTADQSFAGTIDVVDVAWLASDGGELVRDDLTDTVATWGRSLVLDLSTASLTDPYAYIRLYSKYAASVDLDLTVYWRHRWNTTEGIDMMRPPTVTPMTTDAGTTGLASTGVPTTGAVVVGSGPGTPPPTAAGEESSSAADNVGGIVAGILIPILLICVVAAVAVYWFRFRKSDHDDNEAELVNIPESDYGAVSSAPGSTTVSPDSSYGNLGPPASGSPGSPGSPHYIALGGTGSLIPSGAASPGSLTGPRLSQSAVHPDDAWTIRYDELMMDQEIGQGAFGTVFRGRWRSTPVAVKQVAAHAMTEKNLVEFFAEAKLMKELRPHANVVALLGVCQEPLCLITEFLAKGSLSDFLEKPENSLSSQQLQTMLLGIARGVLHLHLEGIIHRDLAAR
jgi:Protein tyrosine and serine/threonine kinase